MKTTFQGELEVDYTRGVVWFNDDMGARLRICKLPLPLPEPLFMDITHMSGASWRGKTWGEDA